MKKLFTLLFSIMLIASAGAQDKKETLKWLNKNKKAIVLINASGYTDNMKLEMTDSFIRGYGKYDGYTHETLLYWSQIKKVTLTWLSDGYCNVTLNTEEEGFRADSITLSVKGVCEEMQEKLSRMARWSGTDVMLETQDLRGLFGE